MRISSFDLSSDSLSDIRFIYFISTLIAISYFLFNFLDVEDSNVYFSRLNYLKGGDVFIYYNGQLAFLSQLVAYLLSGFSPFLQAFGYMLFSLMSFVIFMFLLSKVVQNNLLILIFVCYLGSFFPLLFYNLTNSIWPGLFITALIPVLALKENRNLTWAEFFLVIVFCTSQAPVLTTLPLYLFLLKKTPFDIKLLFLISWLLVFSLFLLPNWDSQRADMLLILKENILFFFSNPLTFFTPNISLKSDFPSRLVEFVSFFGMITIFLVNLFRKHLQDFDFGLILFALGILVLSFGSRISETFFIGPRYFLPSMIFFIILVGPYLINLSRVKTVISIFSILLVFLVFSERYLFGESTRINDLYSLMEGQDANVVIDRGGGWIIPLGEFSRDKQECLNTVTRSEKDRFLIFCGEGEGEILLK